MGIVGRSSVPGRFSSVTTTRLLIFATAITKGSACDLSLRESTKRGNLLRTSVVAIWIALTGGKNIVLFFFAHLCTSSSFFASSVRTSSGATITFFSISSSMLSQRVRNVSGGYHLTHPSRRALVSMQYLKLLPAFGPSKHPVQYHTGVSTLFPDNQTSYSQ